MELLKREKQSIEVNVKEQKQVEHQKIGSIVPHKNHKVFEINKETLEIKEAEYSNTTYHAFSENKKEIIVSDDCVYISAMNKKNALKHFNKNSNGSKL